jgi:carboxylesterase type B
MKTGVLDFINDVKFSIPIDEIASRCRAVRKPLYQYLVDQSNPFQYSARAHHAVDLLFLFGGIDTSFDKAAEKVGAEMRKRWIAFANGSNPWNSGKRFAFGPHGWTGEIDEDQFAARRRVRQCDLLKKVGLDAVGKVVAQLAAGRVSLNN